MSVISLFSGAGGLDLGVVRAGSRVVRAASGCRVQHRRDFVRWRWENYDGLWVLGLTRRREQ